MTSLPYARPLAVTAVASTLMTALACGGGPDPAVIAAYRQAKEAALAPVGPAPKGWAPDAVLQLSDELVEALVAEGVGQLKPTEWAMDAPGVTLKPRLTVDKVIVAEGSACDDCFSVKVVVTGPIRYDAGLLGKGRIQSTVRATLDVVLDVGARGDGFPIVAAVEEVRKVRVELEGVPSAISDAVEPRLTDVVHDQVKRQVEPFEIARPGAGTLPLRALRVKPKGGGVLVELLTEAGTKSTVVPGRPLGDWTLDVAEPAIVRIIAREAFAAGPQDLGLVGELRGLSVTKKGALDLDVRVWRTEGVGWWRDLDVTVAANVRPRSLQLSVEEAKVVASSPGAAFADPVAWLAESVVLDEVEQAAAFALPTMEKADLGGKTADVRLEGLASGRDSLRSFGSVTLR